MKLKTITTEEYIVEEEPYYVEVNREKSLFEAAYRNRIPVLLKGPTGSGKTRFMEYMAWKFRRPLVTVSCHDDLTVSDLVGRYLVRGGETVWVDGPMTRAVKVGGFCYLDEIVEARKDTTVVIHPLADHRRILPIEKRGEMLSAPPEFLLALSYNPGYQSVLKDLKQSTRQRFLALEFTYPRREVETEIIVHEAGVDAHTAERLVSFGEKTRNLVDRGLTEGASTRILIHAAKLIRSDIEPRTACEVGIAETLTDDREMLRALSEIVQSIF
ncbi:MAG: CbbQ/NirQ/NorQ/GpvN family protein [Alphaproteobacteria bacterium]|uniref:CbbQ/NirQ/NorQ/GpvN family protein n=1 Tax=Candidatus Nitrobium versatile TaxID=2884831 RepID=A0A953LXW6_9BACT|nr:CbbQ/NirQ/NorQ/GpvN family protein [Candidatus Nitrobium versatile]